MIPVLISSAGRRGALVQTFRAAGAVVHGCDMQPELSSGCMLADQAHQVPRCSAPDFIDRIEEIVRGNGIRLIVPTIDTELSAFAEAADRLAGVSIHRDVRAWEKPSDHVPLVVELDG